TPRRGTTWYSSWLRVFREPNARELPACVGREEISVSRANVRFWCGAASAAEHKLVAHKLAVVLAKCSRWCVVAWIGIIRAGRPFPHIPQHVLQLSFSLLICHGMKAAVIQEIAGFRSGSCFAARGLAHGL